MLWEAQEQSTEPGLPGDPAGRRAGRVSRARLRTLRRALSPAEYQTSIQEKLPLIVGSSAAALVFLIAVVVIAIVCNRWVGVPRSPGLACGYPAIPVNREGISSSTRDGERPGSAWVPPSGLSHLLLNGPISSPSHCPGQVHCSGWRPETLILQQEEHPRAAGRRTTGAEGVGEGIQIALPLPWLRPLHD